ncbi:MAG: ACT domain-containing protein [Clostridia bacterium]|jgi:hypothetical protein
MLMKQISVFLENKKGRLATLTKVLGDHDIDITALSIADTANFGILRIIVNKPDEALRVIREAGFTVKTAEVIAVKVDDRPGGLAKVLAILEKGDISIEYLYSFVRRPDESALILFRVEDPKKAIKLLQDNGIEVVLNQEEVYSS